MKVIDHSSKERLKFSTSMSFQDFVLYLSELVSFLLATRCNKKEKKKIHNFVKTKTSMIVNTPKKMILEKNILISYIGLSIPFMIGEKYCLHRHTIRKDI